jgi:CDP-2,3-bis-(O-geranylgeranyl)-sn-glycerol synthase
MSWQLIGYSVLLLLVANGAPVIASDLLKQHWRWPIDGGRIFFDGRPWLGKSKTWRGGIAAIMATTIVALLLGMDWTLGLSFAALAMIGDLLASFCKRRLAIRESGRAWLLDQLPESLFPLWLLSDELGLTLMAVFIAAALFTILELTLSPLLYRLHLRQRPY